MPIELLPPDEAVPDNPRWLQLRRAGVTASEIAAVIGVSPWESRFSLYWRKVHGWEIADNVFMANGRHLEGPIADWWVRTHAEPFDHELTIRRAGLYAHPERAWQLATPDRLVVRHWHMTAQLDALLECKWVAASWAGWGEPGTDDIPVYYRAQALWQADTLGVDTVHVAALGPGGFRAYVVRVGEDSEPDLALMRSAAAQFVDDLAAGVVPPLDGHTATISALRRLHPSVGVGAVEVPYELAEAYRQARADRKDADQRVTECEAQIRAALGSTYERAECNGRLVASRSVWEQDTDQAELTALDDDRPVVDRLNPGRAVSYA